MFSIWVPPLRARLEDIPLLVDYFISDCVGQAKRLVTAAAQQVLDLFQQYSWPGNIRELRNVVKGQYGSLKDVPYCSGGL